MVAPLRALFEIGMRTYAAWRADRTLRLGAGLAYYGLFTIVPLVSLTAAVAEALWGRADVQAFLSERLAGLQVSEADAEVVAETLTAELDRTSTRSSLGIVGVASLFFAASLVFLALVDAINVIWDVPVRSGMWRSVRRRLIAFLMVLGTGALLVVDFVVSTISRAAEVLLPGEIAILENLASLVSTVTSWVALAFALTLIFRYLAPENVPWRAALVSGGATALTLVTATWAVGWYLREFGGGSISGAFGAVLAMLFYVYVLAQVLLVGVQLSKVLTQGERAVPATTDGRSPH